MRSRPILEKRNFVKIVCGAGNEDVDQVRQVAEAYSHTDAACLDMNASPDIIKAAREHWDGLIMVSIGQKGDPHTRKAKINREKCSFCGKCVDVCPQIAIYPDCEISMKVTTRMCIGCGKCAEVCPVKAISFSYKERNVKQDIKKCMKAGADMVEWHIATQFPEWHDFREICNLVPDEYVSISLDRGILSSEQLVQRVRTALEYRPEKLMVQADGIPMSGGGGDYTSTLETIATANIIIRSGLPVKVIASGGTNCHTMVLANICGVPIHGVAIGTFARKYLKHAKEIVDANLTSE
jgi:ferredoxin